MIKKEEFLLKCYDLRWTQSELEEDLDNLIAAEIKAHNAQFEGECEWKKKGNVAGICNKTDSDAHNPTIIFVDHLKKVEELIGNFTYCPFCGRKIKQV